MIRISYLPLFIYAMYSFYALLYFPCSSVMLVIHYCYYHYYYYYYYYCYYYYIYWYYINNMNYHYYYHYYYYYIDGHILLCFPKSIQSAAGRKALRPAAIGQYPTIFSFCAEEHLSFCNYIMNENLAILKVQVNGPLFKKRGDNHCYYDYDYDDYDYDDDDYDYNDYDYDDYDYDDYYYDYDYYYYHYYYDYYYYYYYHYYYYYYN